jgi:hypothetical protein
MFSSVPKIPAKGLFVFTDRITGRRLAANRCLRRQRMTSGQSPWAGRHVAQLCVLQLRRRQVTPSQPAVQLPLEWSCATRIGGEASPRRTRTRPHSGPRRPRRLRAFDSSSRTRRPREWRISRTSTSEVRVSAARSKVAPSSCSASAGGAGTNRYGNLVRELIPVSTHLTAPRRD